MLYMLSNKYSTSDSLIDYQIKNDINEILESSLDYCSKFCSKQLKIVFNNPKKINFSIVLPLPPHIFEIYIEFVNRKKKKLKKLKRNHLIFKKKCSKLRKIN